MSSSQLSSRNRAPPLHGHTSAPFVVTPTKVCYVVAGSSGAAVMLISDQFPAVNPVVPTSDDYWMWRVPWCNMLQLCSQGFVNAAAFLNLSCQEETFVPLWRFSQVSTSPKKAMLFTLITKLGTLFLRNLRAHAGGPPTQPLLPSKTCASITRCTASENAERGVSLNESARHERKTAHHLVQTHFQTGAQSQESGTSIATFFLWQLHNTRLWSAQEISAGRKCSVAFTFVFFNVNCFQRTQNWMCTTTGR